MRFYPILILTFFFSIAIGCGAGEENTGKADPSSDSDTDTDTDSDSDSDSDTEDTDAWSCQYINPFASFTCTQYIGSKWDDEKEMEICGQGAIETEAELKHEPCPKEWPAADGESFPAIGPCRIDGGKPEEITIYSYDATVAGAVNACDTILKGDWEGQDVEDADDMRPALKEALDALQTTSTVAVSPNCVDDVCIQDMRENKQNFVFTPLGKEILAGIIIYRGGNVDARAYAPPAAKLAEEGFLVVLVVSSGTIVSSDRADEVRSAHTDIQKWFLVGHSMGAVMAVQYGTTENGKTLAGIIIWDSAVDQTLDISQSGIPVISICASVYDEEARQYFPDDTTYVFIDGGSHDQFGYYDDTGNPNHPEEATISREEQQRQTIEATLGFINTNL